MNYIVLDMEWNQPWPGSPSAKTPIGMTDTTSAKTSARAVIFFQIRTLIKSLLAGFYIFTLTLYETAHNIVNHQVNCTCYHFESVVN